MRTSKKSPLAVDMKGNKFVLTRAIMPQLVSLIDGLRLVFFGKNRTKSYLRLQDAIDWIKKELLDTRGKEMDRLQKSLVVLEDFAKEDCSHPETDERGEP